MCSREVNVGNYHIQALACISLSNCCILRLIILCNSGMRALYHRSLKPQNLAVVKCDMYCIWDCIVIIRTACGGVAERVYYIGYLKKTCFIYIYIYTYILGVARYMYSYRTVTVQASRFGAWGLTTNTGNSPQSRRGARSNATLQDNRQQKNSECQWWHRGGRADVWLTVFYFDKVPTGCKVSNAGTDVLLIITV